MLKEAAFLGLMLIAMVSAGDEPVSTTTTAESTTTTTTTNTTTFVAIGSNHATSNESVVPIVHHAISAQARKIELTQLNSAVSSDVTAALKSPTGSNSSMAIGTTGIAIIVAVAAILIVTVLVGTAIFVMRRRFSVWRLNGSKQNLNAGGAADGGESGTSGSVAGDEKVVVVVTPSDENPNEQITSVENKNAVVNAAAATEDETVKETEVEPKTTTETTDDANKETNEGNKEQQQQDISSQSLIANVLNELSDSVAKKVDEQVDANATETDKPAA